MIDIKLIQKNPHLIKKALEQRGINFDLENLIEVDEKRRAKIKEVDELRAKQNELSEKIAKLDDSERGAKIEESKEIKHNLGHAESELKYLEDEFETFMYKLPNIPLPDVPAGKDESENKVLREEGGKKEFLFKPLDYMELAEKLDLIDIKRASKVSGSRFGYLKKDAAVMEIALVKFAFDRLIRHNFIPIIPPVLISEKMMRGMGYIDSEADRDERYFLEKDKLYLVGTAEQSIGPMHAEEILDEAELPKRYFGFSTCFRREAGSYGKDTHGIFRVHQFDKVEMFIISSREKSEDEHKFLLNIEEELMRALKIPYRVVELCTGDLSRPSAKTYDIQAWLPGQNSGKGGYRETHSCSNTTDFQSRRLNIKVRRKSGLEYVHMLNGTAFAIGRTLIAIFENYQNEDGSIAIPDVLQPYMNGQTIIKN